MKGWFLAATILFLILPAAPAYAATEPAPFCAPDESPHFAFGIAALHDAIGRGLSVELFNHPDGDHAFDVRNDGPRTREAIAGTIDFFRWHLCD